MNTDKLYREPRLSLLQLSKSTQISPKDISRAINVNMQMSFSDFINLFRVEEVKSEMQKQNQKLSLLGLAYDAGFNSKSSFNAVFKKLEGCTPTDFRNRLNLQ